MTSSKVTKNSTAIEAAVKECFVDRSKVAVSVFIAALKERNVATRSKLTQIIESTDYLTLENNNNVVVLTRSIFTGKAVHLPRPLQNTTSKPLQKKPVLPALTDHVTLQGTKATKTAPAPGDHPTAHNISNGTKSVPPLSVNCDTTAIKDILDGIGARQVNLEGTAVTDLFLDVGSNMSVKINGECFQLEK
ncbi:hypothetical protein BG003_000779, partial [Podila horticola]